MPELVDYAQRGEAERTAAALELLRRHERRLLKREWKRQVVTNSGEES